MGRNGKWLFLFFLVILFLLCPAASRGSTILYDGRYGDGYGRILQKYGGNQWDILPETGALTERFTESDITAIEAYDFQAQVIRRNHWNRYEWYPQYVTSMVLAVRDDCPVTISGWQSVKEGQVTLGFPMDTPRQQMGIMAISYGLTGALKKEAAIQYLKQLKKEGRLRLDRRYNEVWYLHSQEKDGAQVYVMTDVEARLLQQQGEAIHIVMPREGTLAFQKGLLAKSHLPLPFSLINRELSLSGYDRVSQGTAVGVQDLQSLAREMGSISGLIRREVVGNPSFEQRFRIPHVVYYSGFLFLVILWGGSLQRRVVKPHLKQLTLCLVAVSVLWIMQRLSKMVIPGSLDIWVRYGWYSYYVFFGILVTLAAFLGYEADAGLEDRKWPCFLYGVGAFNMGLALMVLTNDFHHWVFTFPAGLSAADSIHEYGRGYILLQSSYAIQFILVNGWLYYRIWKQQLWGMKQLIPLFISGLYVFYVVS